MRANREWTEVTCRRQFANAALALAKPQKPSAKDVCVFSPFMIDELRVALGVPLSDTQMLSYMQFQARQYDFDWAMSLRRSATHGVGPAIVVVADA